MTDYLSDQGMSVRLVGKNRLSILADATVDQAQSAFHTSIEKFWITPEDKTDTGQRFSFTTPPQLPSDIATSVIDISGMENFTRPTKTASYLTPIQLQGLYGVAPLVANGRHGQGRTIAISNYDGFRLANVTLECNFYPLAVPPGGAGSNIVVESIGGGAGPTGTQTGEGDLDIQAVIGMAPLCNLIVYDNDNPQGDLNPIAVLTQEVNDNTADLITESYGWAFDTATALSAHNLHLSMSAQGITYLAASGDHGTNYVQNGLTLDYAQIDSEVLTVGGTSATVNANNTRATEVGWASLGDSGGGGWVPSLDTFNVRPAYQLTAPFLAGPGVPSNTTAPYRLIPDVALNADPNNGYLVFDAANSTAVYAGGTSASSPTTAAALAACEQQLIADGFLLPDSFGHMRLGRINDP